jgi:pimeloyl-ACP methyl ester carboxylesterase
MRKRAISALTIGSVLLLSACFSPEEAQQEITAYAPVPGGQIEYVVGGPADGETVVFIHGGGLAESFSPIMRDTALARFQRVRVHRPRYMGTSDPWALENVDDAAAVIAVLDTLDIERAHLVGHSSGGRVAVSTALTYPERVASLVLADADLPPPSSAPISPEIVEFIRRDVEESLSRLSSGCNGEYELERRYGFLGDDWRDYFTSVAGGWEQSVADICRRQEVRGGEPQTVEQVVEQVMAEIRGSESRPALKTIASPVLMLWGSESHLAEGLRDSVQRFASARGQEIPSTDHGLIVQKPSEIAVLISDWLSANPIQ